MLIWQFYYASLITALFVTFWQRIVTLAFNAPVAYMPPLRGIPEG